MQEEELSRVEEDTACAEDVDRDELDKGRAAAAARPDADAWRCKRVPSRTFFRPLPVVAGTLNSPSNQDEAGVRDAARVRMAASELWWSLSSLNSGDEVRVVDCPIDAAQVDEVREDNARDAKDGANNSDRPDVVLAMAPDCRAGVLSYNQCKNAALNEIRTYARALLIRQCATLAMSNQPLRTGRSSGNITSGRQPSHLERNPQREQSKTASPQW
jgi:hypothetical protein